MPHWIPDPRHKILVSVRTEHFLDGYSSDGHTLCLSSNDSDNVLTFGISDDELEALKRDRVITVQLGQYDAVGILHIGRQQNDERKGEAE